MGAGMGEVVVLSKLREDRLAPGLKEKKLVVLEEWKRLHLVSSDDQWPQSPTSETLRILFADLDES